jgi:23S rRNA pseudouridine2604 synthase
MNVSLKGLPTGDWRDLDEQELAGLFMMIESSSSEAPMKKHHPPKQGVSQKAKNGSHGKHPSRHPPKR